MSEPLRVGIIGMGFIGQTHARAFASAEADGHACRIRAACDPDPDRRAGIAVASGNLGSTDQPRLFDPDLVRGFESADKLLASDDVDLVCICTPTDTHVDLTVRAIDAGKHVLVEKPVAITTAEVQRLIDRASASDRRVIPAMCVRYWPGWVELKTMIEESPYGEVRHARFERLGGPPQWSGDFYADKARSGGAIFDLHVHDADFVRYLFGDPEAVFSRGDHSHVHTQAIYHEGPIVSIEGGWLNDPSFPFRMTYTLEFERAVATYDSRRSPPMQLHAAGQVLQPTINTTTGFDEQARAVAAAFESGAGEITLPTLSDALAVTRFIEAEIESFATGRSVRLG